MCSHMCKEEVRQGQTISPLAEEERETTKQRQNQAQANASVERPELMCCPTLTNGACERRESLRAISVFPQPVGPTMRMFLGTTSFLNESGRRWRLQRLRRAMATARLAAAWPTMCWSNRATVSEGLSAVESTAAIPANGARWSERAGLRALSARVAAEWNVDAILCSDDEVSTSSSTVVF